MKQKKTKFLTKKIKFISKTDQKKIKGGIGETDIIDLIGDTDILDTIIIEDIDLI